METFGTDRAPACPHCEGTVCSYKAVPDDGWSEVLPRCVSCGTLLRPFTIRCAVSSLTATLVRNEHAAQETAKRTLTRIADQANGSHRSRTESARTAREPKPSKRLAPWLREKTWLGAEGVSAKERRTHGGAKLGRPARCLEDLLSRPEWAGSDVRDIQDGWSFAPPPTIPREAYGNDPVRVVVEGPMLAVPRILALVVHPSGATARIVKGES